MAYKKAYKIVRAVILIGMITMFFVIDLLVLRYHDFILYLVFIPIEILFILFWWLLLVKYNNSSVIKIKTDNWKIDIITLGNDYTVSADKITVKKGFFHCYLYFNGVKLRALSSGKSVSSFLYKYQNIYKKAGK